MSGHLLLPRRHKRSGRYALMQFGALACGVAAGLVEFLALQRSRFRLPDQQRLPGSRQH